MVDTYGGQESLVYFIVESSYGVTPTTPAMLGVNNDGFEPQVDPGLITVRGVGSRDPQKLYQGLRKPMLQISHVLSPDAPIGFIQNVTTLNSLSIQALYFKGVFASATNIISLLFTGARIDKLTVECKTDDVIRATSNLIGQDLASGTAKITGGTYTDYVGGFLFINLVYQSVMQPVEHKR